MIFQNVTIKVTYYHTNQSQLDLHLSMYETKP